MNKTFIAIFLAIIISIVNYNSVYAQTKQNFNADNAYKYLKTQTDMGVRHYGSAGHSKVRAFIKNEMARLGYKAEVHNFKAPYIENRNGENIYAFLKGKSDKYIILASHYDTRSVAEKDSTAANRNKPIVGANDGGSSTAVLLELMRILKQKEEQLPYSVAFVFFDLEDDGAIYNSNI